jgi:hypothetical protein
MTARAIRRWLRRDPWENAASIVIGLGVVMLMQPFSLWLFGHSLTVILIGTIGFMIVSHFPEELLAAEDGDG